MVSRSIRLRGDWTQIKFAAEAGAYAVSGVDARRHLKRTAAVGALSLTGSAVTLSKTTAGGNWWGDDGSANAPTGISPTGLGIPFPNLLSGYVIRAPWKVVGVDYRAGIQGGVVLKDPATLPTSGSPRRSGNSIILDADNSVLDGYDCSQPWSVSIQGSARNCVVRNCKFYLTSSNASNMVMVSTTGTGSVVEYCEFYGNYFYTVESGFIGFDGPAAGIGGGTVRYCYMERSGSDFIDTFRFNTAPYVIKYNVIHNSSRGGGVHGDWLQSMGGGVGATYLDFIIDFNLCFNIASMSDIAGPWGAANTQPAGGTRGILPAGESGYNATMNGAISVSKNTFIAYGPTGTVQQFVSGCNSAYVGIGPNYSQTVNYNYCDPSGISSWLEQATVPGMQPPVGNRNMLTGAPMSGST